jgi:hypothetical protein
MIELLEWRQLIPLALSVNTVTLMWLVGNKSVLGWVLGLLGQVGWFTFVIVFEAWGLLPLAVALTAVYARNLMRWRREGEPPSLAEVWADGYTLGVADQELSQDWTSGQMKPARANPHHS